MGGVWGRVGLGWKVLHSQRHQEDPVYPQHCLKIVIFHGRKLFSTNTFSIFYPTIANTSNPLEQSLAEFMHIWLHILISLTSLMKGWGLSIKLLQFTMCTHFTLHYGTLLPCDKEQAYFFFISGMKRMDVLTSFLSPFDLLESHEKNFMFFFICFLNSYIN